MLFSIQPVIAAGETYTWGAGGIIQVNGGGLSRSATLRSNSGATGQNNMYLGSFYVKYNGPGATECGMQVNFQTSADQKTGRIFSALPLDSMGGTSTPRCPPAVIAQYLNQTVTIGGTPAGEETDAQKNVRVIIVNPEPESAPDSLTITIGNQKLTAKKTITEGSAYYDLNFKVEAGKHKVCAPPLLKNCEDFTKVKFNPLTLIYGDSAQSQSFDVELSVSFIAQNGQTCEVKAQTVDLKKDGKTIKSIKTNKAKLEPGTGEENSLGGTKESTVFLRGKFEKIPAGNYEVCVSDGQCKPVKREKDKNFDPNPVKFDMKLTNSANICVAIGEKLDPTLPAPPPPPCADNNTAKGCTSFLTAFGKMSTDPEKFIVDLFAILLSISGALALLLIIRAGYTVMTSQGKPEQLKTGREQLIATIVGLLFLIFSFVILEVIGIEILKVPTDAGVVGGGSCTTDPGGGTQGACPDGYSCNATGSCNDPSGRCPGTCTPN